MRIGDAFVPYIDDRVALVILNDDLADVSGDGVPEAIYGSAGYMMYAWDHTGALAEGWPKFTGHWILGSPAVGDITGDGVVGVDDLLDLIASFGPCAGCPADVNGDGVVGVDDFLIVLAAWGTCP